MSETLEEFSGNDNGEELQSPISFVERNNGTSVENIDDYERQKIMNTAGELVGIVEQINAFVKTLDSLSEKNILVEDRQMFDQIRYRESDVMSAIKILRSTFLSSNAGLQTAAREYLGVADYANLIK